MMENTVPKFLFDSLKDSHENYKVRAEFQLDQKDAQIEQRDAEIAELKRQLVEVVEQKEKVVVQKDTCIRKLEKDYLDYKNTLTHTRNIIFHPKIKPSSDRVLLCKLLGIETRKQKDEEGFFDCYRGDIAREAHLSEDAVSDGLKSLVKHGTIQLEHRGTETKGSKNILRIKILPDVKEDVLNCVKEDVKSNYGGERAKQCPECHKERIEKTRKKATLCECKDCKHQWVEDESEKVIVDTQARPQDYTSAPPQPEQPDMPEEEVMEHHMDTLFPEEEKPKAKPERRSDIEDDSKPPKPACPKCGNPKDTWEDTFEYWFCSTCTGKRTERC